MKRLTITLFILATLLLNMLPACDGLDDHYSTNPTYRLSFSTDTLAFDTIFRFSLFLIVRSAQNKG